MIDLTNKLEVTTLDRFIHYFYLLRLSHWSKALFVFLGFIYTPLSGYFSSAALAALAFCLISSAVYIYNDIQDRSEDSLHPHKSQRPIAGDLISVSEASLILFVLLIAGLVLGWMISKTLAIILTSYLIVNVVYNHAFKLIPFLDVGCIATGFMLRVLAGTLGIGLVISSWLIVASTLLSLFIAFNKRRLEMQLGLKKTTRKVLKKYNMKTLNTCIQLTGGASFVTYLLYTVYVQQESFFFLLSLPFAAFALWRFASLTTGAVDNDDPVTLFMNDRLSRINCGCFVILSYLALR